MSPYEAYYRQLAAQKGIDPNTLVRVINNEGGFNNIVNQSGYVKNGYREPSYGPLQLLVGGPGTGFPTGVGNKALAAGIDPRDPNQWQQAADFATDEVVRSGWGQWYGAKKAGITGRMGIGGDPSNVPSAVAQMANQAPSTPQGVPAAVSPGSVAQALAPVVAQQQASQQAMAQNAAVAQQQAATQAAATATPPDPFGGLLGLFAMSQAQPQMPSNVNMTVPRPKQTQPVDPQLQVALTSQTPNVYLDRMRKMRQQYG